MADSRCERAKVSAIVKEIRKFGAQTNHCCQSNTICAWLFLAGATLPEPVREDAAGATCTQFSCPWLGPFMQAMASANLCAHDRAWIGSKVLLMGWAGHWPPESDCHQKAIVS